MNRRTVTRYSNKITTGSTDPYDVTHALSVKLLYVLRIAWGEKPIENRGWIIGPGWYALHTSKTLSSKTEIEQLINILNTIEKNKNTKKNKKKTITHPKYMTGITS